MTEPWLVDVVALLVLVIPVGLLGYGVYVDLTDRPDFDEEDEEENA